MVAKSKSQQRFYGMVHAVQQGKLDPTKASSSVRHAAENTKPGTVKEIASTKHTGLVEKIAMKNYINKYATSYERKYIKKSTSERIQGGALALGAPAALLTTILSSARGNKLATIGRGALIAGTAGTAAGALTLPKKKKIFKKIEDPKDISANMKAMRFIGKSV